MDMSEDGLGLTPMQKVRLKREMEAATQLTAELIGEQNIKPGVTRAI